MTPNQDALDYSGNDTSAWGDDSAITGYASPGYQQPQDDGISSNPYGNSGYSDLADSDTTNTVLGAGDTAYSTVGVRNPYQSGGNLYEVDWFDSPYTESAADPNAQQSRPSAYNQRGYRPTAQDYGDDDQLILGG